MLRDQLHIPFLVEREQRGQIGIEQAQASIVAGQAPLQRLR